jgi:anaerobic magnesium-protoporphyrin IX monomethyl ester cyclase
LSKKGDGFVKKVLLINPGYRYASGKAVQRFDPPLGLLNIASNISDIVDIVIVNSAFEDLPDFGKFDLIGLTVFIGELTTKAEEITLQIKQKHPALPVIWGGPLPSLFPNEILKYYHPDIVVRWDGEMTFREIIQGKNLKDIKGITYRNTSGEITQNVGREAHPLDEYAIPNWSLFGQNYNVKQIPYYTRIHSSRNCPFQCQFCTLQNSDDPKDRVKWRKRSAAHVIAEIENAGAPVVTFGDDNFLVDRKRAIDILGWMRNHGVYAEQIIAHANNVTREMIEAMRGITRTVIYAIESANPVIRERVKKQLKTEHIYDVNKRLYEANITTMHNYIVGWPFEDLNTLKMNVDMQIRLKEINPYVRASSYLFMPLPGTPIAESIPNLPQDFKSYERANFSSGLEFRPWMTENQYEFYQEYNEIFTHLFQANNLTVDSNIVDLIEAREEFKWIFGDISRIQKPKKHNSLYILDDLLDGKRPSFEL